MNMFVMVLAFTTALLSALALYAGSAHCRLPSLERWQGSGTWVGILLAVVSVLAWIVELGVGAGLCVMLGTWMLALMTLPYLALLIGRDADGRGEP